MNENRDMAPSTLASYALLKALTDSKEYRNQYEILAEFIRYIIAQRKYRDFYLIDIQNDLQEEFSFFIPQAAIKTSIKQIRECKKCGDIYSVEGNTFDMSMFSGLQREATNANRAIVDKLYCFATLNQVNIRKDLLEEAFIKYLIDDKLCTSINYAEVISKFLIENESDNEFQKQISAIREGSILFCGLAYNMSELGSIKDDLTIFLDTEVLFNIVGYNGTIYQKLSEDLMNQVKAANYGQKRIKLRFFREVEQEIDSFFRSAELTVMGKGDVLQSIALRSITNGCETISDIRNKQADFYTCLRVNYGIVKDEKEDYYSEADYPYNIEIIPAGFADDEKSHEAIRYISHINKLRKGCNEEDYIKCKYLLVTETRRIQEIANAICKKGFCSHTLPTSVITNILWFKLGCCFSKKDYPANVDASYKARGIISGILSNTVSQAYKEATQNYQDGILSKDQLADRIVMLRDKTQSPDGITAENLEELLDFSPEAIDRYEQGIKANRVKIEEQDQIISFLEEESAAKAYENDCLKKDLSRVNDEIGRKEQLLLSKDEHIASQVKKIQEMNEELERYHKADEKRILRKELWKSIGKFVFWLTLTAFGFALLVFVAMKVVSMVRPEIYEMIKNVIEVCGILGFVSTGVTVVRKKAFGEKKDNNLQEKD